METERISLRHWQESDAEALFKYASDPDVGPRAGWPAHKSEEESLEIIRTFFHNDTTWAIVLKETGEHISTILSLTQFIPFSVYPPTTTLRQFSPGFNVLHPSTDVYKRQGLYLQMPEAALLQAGILQRYLFLFPFYLKS